MNIRCETPLDYPAIAEVDLVAFGRKQEAELVKAIRCSECYIPQLSLVAEIEGAVVGHILFSYIDLVGEKTQRVIGLAPIAVLPQFQRRGIGSALVQAGLEKADAMGEDFAIVLGHPQFYNRFGFQPSVAYGIESPFPVPENFFMVTVYGKGGKTRVILIPPSVWKEVMDFRGKKKTRAEPSAPVFRSRKKGFALTRQSVTDIVKEAAIRAGLSKEVSSHWLRHCHASHSLDRGAPIHLVGQTLGHSSIATTGRYLHCRPSDSSSRYLPL